METATLTQKWYLMNVDCIVMMEHARGNRHVLCRHTKHNPMQDQGWSSINSCANIYGGEGAGLT